MIMVLAPEIRGPCRESRLRADTGNPDCSGPAPAGVFGRFESTVRDRYPPRVLVLAVGGCSSGVGKTTLACRLLEALPGWGALKVTPLHKEPCRGPDRCPICAGIDAEHSLLTLPEDLDRPGSDTDLYRRAGASRVAWLKNRPGNRAAGIEEALRAFDGLPGLIAEGNGFALNASPSASIVVGRAGLREVKPSARPLLPIASWVVVNRSEATPEEEVIRVESSLQRWGAERILELNAAAAVDAGTAGFLREIRTWARG
jgi:molybdopterin-guanine dinucleotide biosynthesis protein